MYRFTNQLKRLSWPLYRGSQLKKMTDYHGYNTPSEGIIDWHIPLNQNFEQIDADVEIRDIEENLTNYPAKENANLLATDTYRIYFSDVSSWVEWAVMPQEKAAPELYFLWVFLLDTHAPYLVDEPLVQKGDAGEDSLGGVPQEHRGTVPTAGAVRRPVRRPPGARSPDGAVIHVTAGRRTRAELPAVVPAGHPAGRPSMSRGARMAPAVRRVLRCEPIRPARTVSCGCGVRQGRARVGSPGEADDAEGEME